MSAASGSLVLLPTYNERENIERIVPRLSALSGDLDVLIIDDASPDGTGQIAESMRIRFPHLSVLHRKAKEGLGRAYVHGFKFALAECYRRIVTMDADLSHAPEDVPRLLAALDDSDVAVGSRHLPGGGVEEWPLWRRALSRAGSFYARSILAIPTRDTTSGFRAYRADALRAIDLDSIGARGFAFQVEILTRILDLPGSRVREVPIRFRNRRQGRSKLSLDIIAEAANEVLRLRFRKVRKPRREMNRKRAAPTRGLPSLSVIIPLRVGTPAPGSLERLRSMAETYGGLEVILARGECPSRQRNLAARKATGDLLLFLDDDSEPAPDLLDVYREAFQQEPDMAAVGGPAIYQGTRFCERLSAALLREPLVMGKSASRYGTWGATRASDERELILSNLAVRRSAFDAAGGFEEALYPNEENLLLDRLRNQGEKIRYQPSASVARPAPHGLELFGKVFRYGQGRAAQGRQNLSSASAFRIAASMLVAIAPLVAFASLLWSAIPLVLLGGCVLTYHCALSSRLARREGLVLGVAAPPVASGIHLAYAAGILSGFFRRLPERREEVTIEKICFGKRRPVHVH